MYNTQCTVYSAQYTMYNVQNTMYSVQCTMYSVQCTMYNVHSSSHTKRTWLCEIAALAYPVLATISSMALWSTFSLEYSYNSL